MLGRSSLWVTRGYLLELESRTKKQVSRERKGRRGRSVRSTVKVAMEVLLQNSSAGEPGGLYLGNQRVVKVCRQPTKFYGKQGLAY